MASVYLVTCLVSGKRYVGFTTKTVDARWREHVRSAKGKNLRQALHKAMKCYGTEAFEVHALATGLCREFALALEAAAINSLGTLNPLGYNLTTGGVCCLLSEETRAKIGAAHKGRKMSDAQIEILRLANTGRTHTAEHKAKIAAAGKGRKASEQTRALLSEKAKSRSPEHLAKIGAARKGLRHSDETKAKIGAASVGRRLSEDSKRLGQETRRASHDTKWGVIKDKALALVAGGVSCSEAGLALEVSTSSVDKWVRAARRAK